MSADYHIEKISFDLFTIHNTSFLNNNLNTL